MRPDPQPSLWQLYTAEEKSRRKTRSVALRNPRIVRSCSKISCPCKGNIARAGEETCSETQMANPRMGR